MDNTLKLKLQNGEEYRAWFNTAYHSLNLQAKKDFEDQQQTKKIGVCLAVDGTILSVRLDNIPLDDPNNIPIERVEVYFFAFNSCLS
jgi:hypothetical protein